MTIRAYLQRIRRFIVSTAGRLAVSYLAVIMGMSLAYSFVLYDASAHELRRQIPPPSAYRQAIVIDDDNALQRPIGDFFESRAAEGQAVLLQRLLLLNAMTLVAGAVFSYYLARRTLQPIVENMEAQTQFVSDASHELRTPLTTLQTSNEVALRNSQLTLAESKELIEQNIEEVAKLQSLTDGLLTLARPEDQQLTVEAVSLQDVAADAMNRVLLLAQSKDVAIEDTVKPQQVLANRQQLAQVVVVLLDNAIKYGPQHGAIALSGGVRNKRGYIAVKDDGPGIRPYDVRRIFDRFYRADQSRSGQNVQGHGIGLSLAKKLVEQQNGEIKVSSAVGKGTTFTVYVPLVPLPESGV